ncbi:MAG: helix-turn-helix domain-containing protein [Actinomycetota bacterium]|nr:helix-turn-helix domain-containing protein [Actinomycetota bacterium]
MDGDRMTLTVEEAAGVLGISRGLAYELVSRGELPHIRLGRRIVVPRRALEGLLSVASTSEGQTCHGGSSWQTPSGAGSDHAIVWADLPVANT